MYQKKTYYEWASIVDDVFNVPERINTLSIIELKEMLLHLEKRHYFLHKGIMHRVSVETAHPSFGTAQHLEYCRKYNSQGGYNIISIENMMAFVKSKIERYNKIIDDPIFEPNIAKDFFEYCIENWISKKTRGQKNALSHLWNKMKNKETESECPYKIRVSGTDFARFYNIEYTTKYSLKPLNEITPKFKTPSEITAASHQIEFKKMLDTFSRQSKKDKG